MLTTSHFGGLRAFCLTVSVETCEQENLLIRRGKLFQELILTSLSRMYLWLLRGGKSALAPLSYSQCAVPGVAHRG